MSISPPSGQSGPSARQHISANSMADRPQRTSPEGRPDRTPVRQVRAVDDLCVSLRSLHSVTVNVPRRCPCRMRCARGSWAHIASRCTAQRWCCRLWSVLCIACMDRRAVNRNRHECRLTFEDGRSAVGRVDQAGIAGSGPECIAAVVSMRTRRQSGHAHLVVLSYVEGS